MRVAVVVRSLKIGGMERAAINLAEAFEENGHESHLIYFKDKGKVLEPNKKVYLHHFNLNKIMKLTIIGTIWHFMSKIINMIFRDSYVFLMAYVMTPIFNFKIKSLEKEYGQFDLIILRGQGTFETIWNIRDKRIVQQQVSVTIRTYNPLKRLYVRCLYSHKKTMCNSSQVADVLIRALEDSNAVEYDIDIIPSPINIKTIQNKSIEFDTDIDTKYIVNVGRFAPGKNIPFLLEAYSYAKENFSLKHKLVLIGDGGERKNIENKINELNLKDSVVLTGFIKNPYPLIKNADLMILTSITEGFPNVLLEALACRTNIVSTRALGGVKDIMTEELENNLVDYDTISLAKKIVYELITPCKVDFDKHIKRFSPSYIVDKYNTIFIKA